MKRRFLILLTALILSLQSFAMAEYADDGGEIGMFGVIDAGDYQIAYTRRLGTGFHDTYSYYNCGVFDADGNVIVEPIYNQILPMSEDRAAFVQDGLIGFFDENWDIIIEPQYACNRYPLNLRITFSDGLCVVGKKSDTEYGYPYKYGYIDRDGNTAIDFIYSDALPFENGVAMVSIDEGVYNYNTKPKTGKIDKSGNIVEPFKFSYARGEDYQWQTDEIDVLMSVNLVDINGRRYTNSDIEYPFINYLGYTYIPLTYYGCRMMGINCDWTAEDGVMLAGGGEVSEDIVGENSLETGKYYKATVYKGKLSVNGTVYEYGDTAYPLIQFRDVVYMPVLWQTGMEALGIEYSYLRADQLENSVDGCMVFKTR